MFVPAVPTHPIVVILCSVENCTIKAEGASLWKIPIDPAAAKAIAEVPVAAEQKVAVTPNIEETHSKVLRFAEEQFQVGQHDVETSRTHIRRFIRKCEVSPRRCYETPPSKLHGRIETTALFVGEWVRKFSPQPSEGSKWRCLMV
jgi:hypothetical protein